MENLFLFNKKNRSTRDPARISLSLLPRNRLGLSTIVTTLILIVLSLVAVGVVWSFVNNLINKQITTSQACYGNSNKVKVNSQYTCYETLGANSYNIRFSLSLADVSADKVIVSISSASTIKSYEITNTLQTISGITPYPSGTQVILPGKNSGLTYRVTGFTSIPDSIKIAPVIGGTQCDISDSLSQIEDCALLA
jgi:hypothetical protein